MIQYYSREEIPKLAKLFRWLTLIHKHLMAMVATMGTWGTSLAVCPTFGPRIKATLGLICIAAIARCTSRASLLHAKYSNNLATVTSTLIRDVCQSMIRCKSVVSHCTLDLVERATSSSTYKYHNYTPIFTSAGCGGQCVRPKAHAGHPRFKT
jgi:hypothetical protein